MTREFYEVAPCPVAEKREILAAGKDWTTVGRISTIARKPPPQIWSRDELTSSIDDTPVSNSPDPISGTAKSAGFQYCAHQVRFVNTPGAVVFP